MFDYTPLRLKTNLEVYNYKTTNPAFGKILNRFYIPYLNFPTKARKP